MKEFAWIISAYEQVDITKENVINCKSIYDKPVYVITTSPKENLFRDIGADHVIVWRDAPGNDELFGSRNENGYITDNIHNHIEWRKKYLPKRVFGSLGRLFMQCFMNGINSAIHLHSDTFWTNPQTLQEELEYIDKYLFIGDLSIDDEASAYAHQEVPPGIHWHPEGIHFNIDRCFEIGFHKIKNIFEQKDFAYHNAHSIEALFGQFAHFCLTGKNLLKITDSVDTLYTDSCRNRMSRKYHGMFPHILNLHGMQ